MGLYEYINPNINAEKLSIKLYNKCSDMDFNDYADEKEKEIHKIKLEIQDLIDNDYVFILKILEILSESEV